MRRSQILLTKQQIEQSKLNSDIRNHQLSLEFVTDSLKDSDDKKEHLQKIISSSMNQIHQNERLKLQEQDAAERMKNIVLAEKAYTYKFKKSLTEGQCQVFFNKEHQQA
jgi:hypothetical protein